MSEDFKPEDTHVPEDNYVDISVPPIGNVPVNEAPKKKGKGALVIIIVIVLIALMGVGLVFFLSKYDKPNNETNKPTETIQTQTEPKKVSYAITKNSLDNFDLAFLKLENNKKNMIYSPLSIKYALGMLMQGSAGDTLTQINEVLGQYKFHKFTNNKNMSFANALFIKNTYKNSVSTTYIDNLKKNFGAEVKYDTFKKPDVVNKYVSEKTFKLINNIVDDISKDDYVLLNALAIDMNWIKKIQPEYREEDTEEDEILSVYYPHMNYSKLIDYLNETDYHELSFNSDPIARQSVEIGAVINNYDIEAALGKEKIKKIVMDDYNAWVAKGAPDACEECTDNCDLDDEDCDETCTKDTKFDFEKYYKELTSSYKRVDTSTDFEFYTDDNVKVFKKDLKKYGDTQLSYIAIMPTKDTLENYINNVTEADINSLIRKVKSIKLDNFKKGVITEIKGYIPLFKFDSELKLIEDLNKLGITDVFDKDKANLSNLTSSQSYINNALHKANIEFTNLGIKASAVTMGGGRGGGDCGYDYKFLPPVEVIDLTFDKPFMFLIVDKSTEEVWFTGRVYEPDKYKSYQETYRELHPEEFDDEEEED